MKHVWKPTRSLLAVLTACASLSALTASGQTVPPPAPYGALPSQGQLQWHEMEMYNMIEFNQINYLDKDWGWGDESPEIVNPVNFNAEEIVLRAKKAGSKGFLINAKHHGGFCMWPSRTTDYNISRSPWRNGKGDWVGEWEAACRKHGLKFGVYLSPWDRNTAKFGTPEYLDMFKAQLRELLTQYGDLFIIWFDGAPGEGGDGYYGGANEYRGGFLDYYDWENIYALCRELQPNAVIFGDPGPDVRWVGNEKGYAGETCWATLFAPGEKWNGRPIPSGAPEHIKRINEGSRNGQYWIPAEADFSLRIRFYAPVALAVSEVGCYKEPDGAVAPVISRTKAGEVSLQVERPVYQLRYTTDGSVPSVSSPLYTGPFTFAREGAVRAVAFDKDGRKGEEAVRTFDACKRNWRILTADGQPYAAAGALVDDDAQTFWRSPSQDKDAAFRPQSLVIDLGETQEVKGFSYTPRQDNSSEGVIDRLALMTSEDGKNWTPVYEDFIPNIRQAPVYRSFRLKTPVSCRYLKLTALRVLEGNYATGAEFGILLK
ncbi:alpha-L-fucosidase [Phocaeicola coprophilus]|uniref:alpha-L-fucosidase n=1 Tax=Phocaeicola coprophilus TaxID=387090 RepID=UPI00266B60DB|nr:alpha-L-fucosidase [Phocaeicola coprophilus]